jgi:alpha-L-fucosidase
MVKANGDAIYGTRPWTSFGEGPTKVEAGSFHDTQTKPYTADDFRFTTKGEILYAIEMAWPKEGEAVIHTLSDDIVGARKVSEVSLLGASAKLAFTQGADGLHIKVPAEAPGKYAYVYRISFEDAKRQ